MKKIKQARPTKMALSSEKRNYVIAMDGFIFGRLTYLDCVVVKGSHFVIGKFTTLNKNHCVEYIFWLL